MRAMHKVYRAKITTLTPLHIGTGTSLLLDYDFVSRGGKTWVINNDELAREMGDIEDPEYRRRLGTARPAELLHDADFVEGSPFFRYVLNGESRARESGSLVQETIKDPWDRPYIPGSSLKGAIRTALAYTLWPENQPVPYQQITARRVKQAAEPMEQVVLYGREARPHYDVMRAFHVADSAAGDKQSMALFNVQVVTGDKPQSPIELEAVRREVTFETTITLDLDLLRRADVLGWSDEQVKALRNFRVRVNRHALLRIGQMEEAGWRNAPPHLASFYKNLAERALKLDETKNGFITQLGWGGGWDSKTFGAILTSDKAQFARVVQAFGKFMDKQQSFKPGDLYPRSRRVTVVNDKPARPLGWIEVMLEAES